MRHMTSEQAQRRADLIKRLESYREKRARMLAELDAERDELIREAKADGMANTETADHMGAGRNTVISVLNIEQIARDLLPAYDRSTSGPGDAVLERVKQYPPQDRARIIARLNILAGA